MKRRMFKLVALLYAFFGLTSVAQASGGFGFFTDTLGALFTIPFRIVGCIGG
jgi:hypothetical protein